MKFACRQAGGGLVVSYARIAVSVTDQTGQPAGSTLTLALTIVSPVTKHTVSSWLSFLFWPVSSAVHSVFHSFWLLITAFSLPLCCD